LSAAEGVRSARSGYFPTVKAAADAGPEYVNNTTRRTTNDEAFYEGRETTGLTVTQKLFDGFATDSLVEAAKITRDISGADLRATRQTTLLEGTLAYVNVLRYTKLIQLARDNERKVQEQLHLEDERVQKGAGIASDVLDAKQRLQISKEKRVAFEGGFEEAVAAYTQVYGRAPEVAQLADPVVPAALIPATLDDALAAAEQENPTLETAARTVELTDERRRTAEAGYYPTLDLIGKGNYENDKNAAEGTRRDWSLLLTANWELFSGFRTNAQVAQATYDHAASKDTQLYTGRKVAETVRKAWHKLQVGRQRTSLLENAAVLAEEVWEARKKQRDAGKATVTEVLDQETRVDDARITYTMAYYDTILASYELLAAMGRFEVDALTSVAPAPSKAVPAEAQRETKAAPLPPKPDLTAPLGSPPAEDTELRSHVQTLVQQSAGPALVPGGLNPQHYRR
jgi:adhesin transport system outer membrane protein